MWHAYPRVVVAQGAEEDERDEAAQEHHHHGRVEDGEPVNLVPEEADVARRKETSEELFSEMPEKPGRPGGGTDDSIHRVC